PLAKKLLSCAQRKPARFSLLQPRTRGFDAALRLCLPELQRRVRTAGSLFGYPDLPVLRRRQIAKASRQDRRGDKISRHRQILAPSRGKVGRPLQFQLRRASNQEELRVQ